MTSIVLTRPRMAEGEGFFTRLGLAIDNWARRAGERAALARLSDRELRDIGLTPYERSFEIRKPYWLE